MISPVMQHCKLIQSNQLITQLNSINLLPVVSLHSKPEVHMLIGNHDMLHQSTACRRLHWNIGALELHLDEQIKLLWISDASGSQRDQAPRAHAAVSSQSRRDRSLSRAPAVRNGGAFRAVVMAHMSVLNVPIVGCIEQWQQCPSPAPIEALCRLSTYL